MEGSIIEVWKIAFIKAIAKEVNLMKTILFLNNRQRKTAEQTTTFSDSYSRKRIVID